MWVSGVFGFLAVLDIQIRCQRAPTTNSENQSPTTRVKSSLSPFHSQGWSISNFTWSLTRNITSHSMKNLTFPTTSVEHERCIIAMMRVTRRRWIRLNSLRADTQFIRFVLTLLSGIGLTGVCNIIIRVLLNRTTAPSVSNLSRVYYDYGPTTDEKKSHYRFLTSEEAW